MLIEMFIKGLMIDPVNNTPIVILRDDENERTLPIWVGPVEANAIALQIENVAPPRPMTHDLLRNIVGELGATLRRVVISDLREGTFFAYLELAGDDGPVYIDSRPSDALALSLRAKAPIFVDTRGTGTGPPGRVLHRSGRPGAAPALAGKSRSGRHGLQDVVRIS